MTESLLAGGFEAAALLQDDVEARRWRVRLAERLFGVTPAPVVDVHVVPR